MYENELMEILGEPEWIHRKDKETWVRYDKRVMIELIWGRYQVHYRTANVGSFDELSDALEYGSTF